MNDVNYEGSKGNGEEYEVEEEDGSYEADDEDKSIVKSKKSKAICKKRPSIKTQKSHLNPSSIPNLALCNGMPPLNNSTNPFMLMM